MADIEFTVWGRVVPAARPRVTRRGTYIPKRCRDYQALVRSAFTDAGGTRFDGPVAVRVDIYRALPKSRPKRVTSEPDTFKPDADNIAKNILDALNPSKDHPDGLAWADDGQVVDLHVVKHPRTRDLERVVVRVSRA